MPKAAFATILGAVLFVPAGIAAPQSNLNESSVEQIRKELVTLPNFDLFDDIRFRIEGNTVVLTGFASRPALKTSAESVVKDVAGVERAVNRIEILPLSRFDGEVRTGAYVAIHGDPAPARYNPNRGVPLPMPPARIAAGITSDPPPGVHPIRIIVNNGKLTLAGVAGTALDKQVAGARADNVFGALPVENEIQAASGK